MKLHKEQIHSPGPQHGQLEARAKNQVFWERKLIDLHKKNIPSAGPQNGQLAARAKNRLVEKGN